MADKYQEQLRKNLQTRTTEELLDIWQNEDPTTWNEAAFGFIKVILGQRLGRVPSQSIRYQVYRILLRVDMHLEHDELDEALRECNQAIKLKPDHAPSYNYRGEIHEEMGHSEQAILDYQQALLLDPDLKTARRNLPIIEDEIKIQFLKSAAKRHLDRALEYASKGRADKGLRECRLAEPGLPPIAFAHNTHGIVLQHLGQVEEAIESYLRAIRLNSRYYPARENLATARLRLEEEQYFQASAERRRIKPGGAHMIDHPTRRPSPGIREKIAPIPQWLYMDETGYLLTGWPGHRTRAGRSGYDPLDSDFEEAHIEGVIFRLLLTRKFRTRNPFFLLLMACLGLGFFIPFLALPGLFQGEGISIFILVLYSPYWVTGIALWINIISSLHAILTGLEDTHGRTFF